MVSKPLVLRDYYTQIHTQTAPTNHRSDLRPEPEPEPELKPEPESETPQKNYNERRP